MPFFNCSSDSLLKYCSQSPLCHIQYYCTIPAKTHKRLLSQLCLKRPLVLILNEMVSRFLDGLKHNQLILTLIAIPQGHYSLSKGHKREDATPIHYSLSKRYIKWSLQNQVITSLPIVPLVERATPLVDMAIIIRMLTFLS